MYKGNEMEPINIQKEWWQKATEYFKKQVEEKLNSEEFKNIVREAVKEKLQDCKITVKQPSNDVKNTVKPYSFNNSFDDIFGKDDIK